MIELYFNDANLLPENREEEQYAEATLNNILAGKTADTEMCILLLRCSAAQGAAVPSERRHNAADQTPILNEAGEPELFIRCVTEETVEEMMEGVKP